MRRAHSLSTLHSPLSTPHGFTLVEMLVATALVVLMMLLFANIFSGAVNTMNSQRGLANNDQKARTFINTLRGDLLKATYRAPVSRGSSIVYYPEDLNGNRGTPDAGEDQNGNGILDGYTESPHGIVPLAPGDRIDPHQRGYIYIAENDPLDDTDDRLQFTVFVEEDQRDPVVSDPNQAPFRGRAISLGPVNSNQPDFDDGQISGPIGTRGAGASRAAEVSYFLRNGILYRRVVLIRDPSRYADPPLDTQPSFGSSGTGGTMNAPTVGPFGVPYALTGNSFYNDWDYSVTRLWALDDGNGAPDPEGTDGFSLHFHGIESLDNSLGRANVPLGMPGNRFGFYQFDGRPHEWLLIGAGAPTAYIGAPTHEETSNANFVYPGVEAVPANHPYRRTDLTLNANGIISQYAGGSRAGEDILLTGVEAFNIEVWDPGYQEPADGSNMNNMFDPYVPDEDINGNGVRDFGAWVNLGNASGIGCYAQASPSSGNASWGNLNPGYGSIPLSGPFGGNRCYDTWHPMAARDWQDNIRDWNGDTMIQAGEAQPPFRPLQVAPTAGVTWAAGSPAAAGTAVFPDAFRGNFSIVYIALNSGTTGSRLPEWPREPGAVVRDGGVLWKCIDNRIGLDLIRITIRLTDTQSGRPRQVTLVHSFAE